jgi:muramoyltetrapeptide carboxypeptidase LdcA involved in peptidoglycan recycling
VEAGKEKPEVIVFLGDMDQISALSILANYHREDNLNVIFPYAAGCQSIGIYPYQEAKSEKPRAVLGLSDISARVAIKRLLKDDLMSFAVPFRLFQEMEENVPGSFLERNTWKDLMAVRSKS